MQTKRKSTIELLRIIAMLLVMIVHADFLALGYPSVDDISNAPFSSFAIYLVHCFPVFYKNIYLAKINEWFTNLNIFPFILFTALWIFCIAIFAVLLDKCRLYVWTLIKSKQIANKK